MLKIILNLPPRDSGAIQHLFSNLELILTNMDNIISVPEYYNVQIPGCYIGGAYIGRCDLRLGDMLMLWRDTNWHTGPRYYFNIVGSPLSGTNTAYWWDAALQKFASGAFSDGRYGFIGLAGPALNYTQRGMYRYDKTRPAVLTPRAPTPSKLNIYDIVRYLGEKELVR